MTQFVEVPPQRLQADILQALLEEYASRDGTDYGERELSLEREVLIVFDVDSDQWDLLPAPRARELLED
jgi:uncharacterized protein